MFVSGGPIRVAVADFSVREIPAGARQRLRLVIDRLPDGQDLAFPAVVARGRAPGRPCSSPARCTGTSTRGRSRSRTCSRNSIRRRCGARSSACPSRTARRSPRRRGRAPGTTRTSRGSSPAAATARRASGSRTRTRRTCSRRSTCCSTCTAAGTRTRCTRSPATSCGPGMLGRIQRAAAIAFGLDLVWGTGGLPGRSLSAAGERGLPAIYVEMPGEGRCRPGDRQRGRGASGTSWRSSGSSRARIRPTRRGFLVEMPAQGSGHLQVDHLSPTSGLFVPAVARVGPRRGRPVARRGARSGRDGARRGAGRARRARAVSPHAAPRGVRRCAGVRAALAEDASQ